LITTAVEYDRAGEDRRDLAQKIIDAQIALAKAGYCTGGAPFGFRRCLVRTDGTRVRVLEDGEHVRTRGQHVVWEPGPAQKFEIRQRILQMLTKMPATQVARQLTAEGVPSPDAGRCRTDSGVEHEVSGTWHSTTIVSIGRHPINRALMPYGRRSMGDKLRFSADGPRELEEVDYRHDGKPKVVANSVEAIVVGQAKFEPLISDDASEELDRILNERAGTQRGKPRSRDPERNPLGARIFDLACGWPMYRQPHNGSWRYVCGLYYQAHAQRCNHNTVDGPQIVRFVLAFVRKRIADRRLMAKVEQRLEAIAAAQGQRDPGAEAHDAARVKLAELDRQIALAPKNLALAETEAQRQALAQVFNELQARRPAIERVAKHHHEMVDVRRRLVLDWRQPWTCYAGWEN
jgi:hypothetical protein